MGDVTWKPESEVWMLYTQPSTWILDPDLWLPAMGGIEASGTMDN